MPVPRLYLASRSPRRLALLTQIGIEAVALPADIDESPLADETPETLALRLAQDKARCVWRHLQDENLPLAPVLAADTVVALEDGTIVDKPANAAAGVEGLLRLAGRSHWVLTAAVLQCEQGERHCLSRSRVHFRDISRQEAERYWASGEPADKTGGYAIQGLGAVFVESIEGSYSGIMGLPLFETARLLQDCGVGIL